MSDSKEISSLSVVRTDYTQFDKAEQPDPKGQLQTNNRKVIITVLDPKKPETLSFETTNDKSQKILQKPQDPVNKPHPNIKKLDNPKESSVVNKIFTFVKNLFNSIFGKKLDIEISSPRDFVHVTEGSVLPPQDPNIEHSSFHSISSDSIDKHIRDLHDVPKKSSALKADVKEQIKKIKQDRAERNNSQPIYSEHVDDALLKESSESIIRLLKKSGEAIKEANKNIQSLSTDKSTENFVTQQKNLSKIIDDQHFNITLYTSMIGLDENTSYQLISYLRNKQFDSDDTLSPKLKAFINQNTDVVRQFEQNEMKINELTQLVNDAYKNLTEDRKE